MTDDPMQDTKYEFRDCRVFNRFDGLQIPADEPVFVFRARDKHAVSTLIEYATKLEDSHHKTAVLGRVSAFMEFQRDNPDRVKEPDTASMHMRTIVMHNPRYRPKAKA